MPFSRDRTSPDCPVIRYTKTLAEQPVVVPASGVRVRSFGQPRDAEAWLRLRQAALADHVAAGRDWQLCDFRRELVDKPWFDPAFLWLADVALGDGQPSLAGSVALQLAHEQSAVVHWLLVAPEVRRQGIGTHLLQLAESAAWQTNHRQLRLETLATWRAACRLYTSLGYQQA